MITTTINTQTDTDNVTLTRTPYGTALKTTGTYALEVKYFGRSFTNKIIYGIKTAVYKNVAGVNTIVGSVTDIVPPIKSSSFADASVNFVLDSDPSSPLRVTVTGQAAEGTMQWDLEIKLTQARV